MVWVDYGGQDITGYDLIGTDDFKLPISANLDVAATVAEIQRRCGRLARIKLFKKESVVDGGNR